jgi:hypothetical protein
VSYAILFAGIEYLKCSLVYKVEGEPRLFVSK